MLEDLVEVELDLVEVLEPVLEVEVELEGCAVAPDLVALALSRLLDVGAVEVAERVVVVREVVLVLELFVVVWVAAARASRTVRALAFEPAALTAGMVAVRVAKVFSGCSRA